MKIKLKLLYLLFTPLLCYIFVIRNFTNNIWRKRIMKTFMELVDYEENPHPITFVSGFINIGTIQKFNDGFRGKETYYEWAKVYGRLNAPMVIFTNDLVFMEKVSTSRVKFKSITKLIFVQNIYELPGFQYYNQTAKLFASPDYPKITLITTNAKYTCVMHSKYDFLKTSIENNYFQTPYFAWTDIGSVRYMGGSDETLNVTVPPQLNESRIAFYEYAKIDITMSVAEAMSNYRVWVTGNFFIGKAALMARFVNQYQKFVDKMMAMNLMSTDENILYAMYTKEGYTPDMVDIQVLHGPNDKCDPWFHMMYLLTNHSCLGISEI